jgi:methionyl-tRNA formyltransferase
MKVKVVFLGGKDIGLKCFKVLYENIDNLNIELIGVDPSPRGTSILNFIESAGITNLHGTIPPCDIIISVQYHRVLSNKEILKAAVCAVNLHMAPLPDYRGCNQFSFAIINKAKEFGVTLHEITTGIDSGPIIAEDRFKINDSIWVDELVRLSKERSLDLFENSLPLIINGKYNAINQDLLLNKRKSSFYLRRDIENIKAIDLSWDIEKIDRHIRATLMPGFEGPYVMVNGRKIFFSRENSSD